MFINNFTLITAYLKYYIKENKMIDLKNLSDSQLNHLLVSLREELEDLKEQKSVSFEQAGLHIVSDKVNYQFKEINEEILNLEERIGRISGEIKNRQI